MDSPVGRIEITRLSKSFRGVHAVADLSFTVEPGTVVGFLGPNGAGKTTTLRMLLGLARPDSGEALIDGAPYRQLARPNDRVGAVVDSSGFHQQRSGRAHLRIYCTVSGYPLSRADEVLEQVGLASAARRKVGGYSLGMRQRLALAQALLGDPDVLVLDEPANGLDPEGMVWMRELLREQAGAGKTVLVSSHVLSEVQQVADSVIIVNKGRLVKQGTVAELSRMQSDTVLVRTTDPDALAAALASFDDLVAERAGADQVRVTGASSTEIGRRAYASGVDVVEIKQEQGDLEQIFFALTGPEAK